MFHCPIDLGILDDIHNAMYSMRTLKGGLSGKIEDYSGIYFSEELDIKVN